MINIHAGGCKIKLRTNSTINTEIPFIPAKEGITMQDGFTQLSKMLTSKLPIDILITWKTFSVYNNHRNTTQSTNFGKSITCVLLKKKQEPGSYT